jgi:hypothetical protein
MAFLARSCWLFGNLYLPNPKIIGFKVLVCYSVVRSSHNYYLFSQLFFTWFFSANQVHFLMLQHQLVGPSAFFWNLSEFRVKSELRSDEEGSWQRLKKPFKNCILYKFIYKLYFIEWVMYYITYIKSKESVLNLTSFLHSESSPEQNVWSKSWNDRSAFFRKTRSTEFEGWDRSEICERKSDSDPWSHDASNLYHFYIRALHKKAFWMRIFLFSKKFSTNLE